MRRYKAERETSRVQVDSLEKGDRIALCTARNTYSFWVEFPDVSVGVAQGGVLPSPSRVRLTAEGTATDEVSTRPLAIGERAQFELLDPNGKPLRRFLTSPLVSLTVHRRRHAAA
jgi:hypothetical protein